MCGCADLAACLLVLLRDRGLVELIVSQLDPLCKCENDQLSGYCGHNRLRQFAEADRRFQEPAAKREAVRHPH